MNTRRSPDDSFSPATPRPFPWKRLLKPLLTAVVLAAIARYLWMLSRDWQEQTGDFHFELRPAWIVASAAFYLIGMTLFGLFWRRLLAASGIHIPRTELLRTYFIGGLGKYIPGKAFVLILRTGMVQHHHVRKLPIVLSIFYETLAMMAAGAAVAAVCLLWVVPQQSLWWGASLAVAAGLGSGLHPTFFGFFSRMLAKPFTDDGVAPSASPWLRVLLQSGYLSLAAWLLLGFSAVAAAVGIGMTCSSFQDIVLVTGAVALACAAGFVVIFMPSGIGVREFVVVALLSPRYGAGAAIAVSLVLRTVWTIADLGSALLVYPLRPTAAPKLDLGSQSSQA